jgi:hypothetical protein
MTIKIGEDEGAAGSQFFSPGLAEEHGELRASYERDHAVRLRGFLSGQLLERIQGHLEEEEWTVREHAGMTSSELWLDHGAAPALLLFLTNDAQFFEVVRAITGCGRIGVFDGRVFRMMPGPQNAISWHNDIDGNRMVAMSINLGREPYEGGVLEIRNPHSGEVLSQWADPEPGDATMFRLDPDLQHRIGGLEGETPRTAFAGWFKTGPEYPLLDPGRALQR